MKIKIVLSIFAIVGLIMFVLGINFAANAISFRAGAIQTEAVITRIDVDRSFDETKHTVFVAFSVDDERYEGRLGHWSSGMREGQRVNIYYNPANPRQFRHGSDIWVTLMVVVMGFTFFLVGVIPLFKMSRRKKQAKELMAKGRRVMADIKDVVKGNLRIKRSFTYHVLCSWKDEKSIFHLFKSDMLMGYPVLDDCKQVAVYLDPNDYTKYHVDLSNISIRMTGPTNETVPAFKIRIR